MQNTKLFTLFSVLSAWELRKWRQFLVSPFMNRREDVVQLFDHLIQEQKNKKSDFTKEKAFARLYPNEPFDDVKIVMLMSRLYRLGEKYLAFRRMEKDENLLKINAAQEFRILKMEGNFDKMISDARHVLDKKPYRNCDYLGQLYGIEYELYDYFESQKRGHDSILQKIIQAFDHYTLTNKLKLACHILAQTTVSKKKIDVGLLDELILFIEKDPKVLEEPALAIYYNLYKLNDEANDHCFVKLKELVPHYKSIFYPNEVKDILILMINFCIKKTNKGIEQYLAESFELYKMGVEEEYFLENDLISPFTFNNLVGLALRLKKLAWAESFIHSYQNKISEKHRTTIFNYNAAQISYHQGNYEKAMRILSNFNANDLLLNLKAKFLLLKTYFELGDDYFEVLDSAIHSTRMYLQRRKETLSYHKDYLENFLRFFKRILDLPHFDEESKMKLLQEIKEEQNIFDKVWLIEKLKM